MSRQMDHTMDFLDTLLQKVNVGELSKANSFERVRRTRNAFVDIQQNLTVEQQGHLAQAFTLGLYLQAIGNASEMKINDKIYSVSDTTTLFEEQLALAGVKKGYVSALLQRTYQKVRQNSQDKIVAVIRNMAQSINPYENMTSLRNACGKDLVFLTFKNYYSDRVDVVAKVLSWCNTHVVQQNQKRIAKDFMFKCLKNLTAKVNSNDYLIANLNIDVQLQLRIAMRMSSHYTSTNGAALASIRETLAKREINLATLNKLTEQAYQLYNIDVEKVETSVRVSGLRNQRQNGDNNSSADQLDNYEEVEEVNGSDDTSQNYKDNQSVMDSGNTMSSQGTSSGNGISSPNGSSSSTVEPFHYKPSQATLEYENQVINQGRTQSGNGMTRGKSSSQRGKGRT